MRQGPLLRMLMTVVLAVVTPLCCCQLRGVWGSGGCCVAAVSADATGPADAASLIDLDSAGDCCCEGGVACVAAREGAPGDERGPAERCGKKSCCVKGFAPVGEWSPVVDVVGVAAPDFVLADAGVLRAAVDDAGVAAARAGPPERAVLAAGMSLVRLHCALLI